MWKKKKRTFSHRSPCVSRKLNTMGKDDLLSAYCMQALCEVLLCILHRWGNWLPEIKCHKKGMDGIGRPQQNKPRLSPGAAPPGRVLGAVGRWSLTLNEDWSKRATAYNLYHLPGAFLVGLRWVLETILQVDAPTPCQRHVPRVLVSVSSLAWFRAPLTCHLLRKAILTNPCKMLIPLQSLPAPSLPSWLWWLPGIMFPRFLVYYVTPSECKSLWRSCAPRCFQHLITVSDTEQRFPNVCLIRKNTFLLFYNSVYSSETAGCVMAIKLLHLGKFCFFHLLNGDNKITSC